MKALSTKKRSGGGGRTVSKVKRGNQKRNKLIKKGKLRPNSTSTYVKAQELKGAEAKRQREERQLQQKRCQRERADQQLGHAHQGEDEENGQGEEEELMDLEDAMLLTQAANGHRGPAENDVEDVERLAMERQRKRARLDEEEDTEEKALLPTKTKDGQLVTQTVRVKKKKVLEEEEEEEEEELPSKGQHKPSVNGHQTNGRHDNASDVELDGQDAVGEPKSVVSMLAEREEALAAFKLRLGSAASSFLELPEERIGHLEKLVAAIDDIPVEIPVAGFHLVATTVTELLKDVLPSYRISHHDEQEDKVLKKVTMKLQSFENGLLKCAKGFLVQMEKLVRVQRGRGKGSAGSGHLAKRLCALRCICDLMATHPHFNYAHNILKLVVPCLSDSHPEVRAAVGDAVRRVFREDKRGDISLAAVRFIRGFVKSKKYNVKPDVLEVFTSIRLAYVERALEDQKEEAAKADRKDKKGRPLVSKKEKKRRKQLEKVEREMLEAKGEEAKAVRNKNFTEVAKAVFEVLFRVIKSHEEYPALLPPALKCLSIFAHTINVDFFDDLLRVLSSIVRLSEEAESGNGNNVRKAPGFSERLLCIKTAFDILSGPGNSLTYDPGHFTRSLLASLPRLSSNLGSTKDDHAAPPNTVTVATACGICRRVLVARRRLVAPDTVRAFCKAMATAALATLNEEDAIMLLKELMAIRAVHLRTFESLLAFEEEGDGPPSSLAAATTANSFGHNLWELVTLRQHAAKEVAELAKSLMEIQK